MDKIDRTPKKVIIRDVITNLSIKRKSIYDANKWFYENNITKSKRGAFTGIRRSLNDKKIIFGHYLVIEDKD